MISIMHAYRSLSVQSRTPLVVVNEAKVHPIKLLDILFSLLLCNYIDTCSKSNKKSSTIGQFVGHYSAGKSAQGKAWRDGWPLHMRTGGRGDAWTRR